MKKKIILASTSTYRAALLQRLGLAFECVRPETDETALRGENPAATALRLSIAKAQNVAARFPDVLVIGADQVADHAGTAIGKPGTRDAARAQLRMMRGQTLIFHSGLALVNAADARVQSTVVDTTVRYRTYSDTEIENYLDRENAFDCAGSAKSEGLGIALVAAMQSDDPSALIGLPLIALIDMLHNDKIDVLQ